MTRYRMLLAGLLVSASLPALAQQTAPAAYGPSLAAGGLDTPPAAIGDTPASPDAAYRAPPPPGLTHPDPVAADGTAAPSLSDALAEVYLTNPTLLAARAQLRSTDENVPAALAGWRPQVSVSVTPGYGFGTIQTSQLGFTSPAEENNRFSNSEQMTISQPIYRGGKTVAAVAGAENTVRAQRARLLAQEEQSFADTVTDFVMVIEDQQLYELQVSNVQVLSRQLQATNARFSVGEITRTDVAQAQAALAGAVAERETALGTLQTARATYRQEVGELPDKLIEPQPLVLPVKSAEEADTLASTNNASVVAAMYDDAASKDMIDTAYSALMPQVIVQGSGGYSNGTSQVGYKQVGGTVGASITVPIYQGGSEYAAIRQAKQNEQQSRKTVDSTRRQAVQQATEYWETYVAAKATVASTRAQIAADEVALDGVEREALAGTQTTLDVLNAEQLLLSARTTLVQNLAALVTASYNVAAAVGRLSARDLALKVPLYDDTAYYHAVRDRPFGTNDEATSQPGR